HAQHPSAQQVIEGIGAPRTVEHGKDGRDQAKHRSSDHSSRLPRVYEGRCAHTAVTGSAHGFAYSGCPSEAATDCRVCTFAPAGTSFNGASWLNCSAR